MIITEVVTGNMLGLQPQACLNSMSLFFSYSFPLYPLHLLT